MEVPPRTRATRPDGPERSGGDTLEGAAGGAHAARQHKPRHNFVDLSADVSRPYQVMVNP
jgi:hypothetical protein